MAIFTVISQPGKNSHMLPGVIAKLYPNSHYQLSESAWLVAAAGTATEVSNKIGISDGQNGSALVLEISDYFGRANSNIWTWIKNKWEAT